MSALIINDVPIECINQAALAYHVPAVLIISVLKTENGKIGLAQKNKNGTYDYGPMQINTVWLPYIKRYGYTKEKILYDACANVAVGTWILSQEIANDKTLWHGVGGYHSHTFDKNLYYGNKVKAIYTWINHQLDTNDS